MPKFIFKGHCHLESTPRATEGLSPGKEYEAEILPGCEHSQDMLYLQDDLGKSRHLFKYRFKEVKPCLDDLK